MSEGVSVAKSGQAQHSRNPFARAKRYFRQVVAELRKVVWPTRKELWTYFTVVVVFIIAIMAFTGLLDFIFDRVVMWAFA